MKQKIQRYSRTVKQVIALLVVCHLSLMTAVAQQFFNLTAQQVKIDTVMPLFTYSLPLGAHYADSVYTVTIAYPEFIDVSAADAQQCERIAGTSLPSLPAVNQHVSISRKQGALDVSFVPVVYRNGRYQKLVSFMLRIKSKPVSKKMMRVLASRRVETASGRYAEHSVLQSGRWAKIRVSASGIHQLTNDVIRQAGFSDASKVKIYGYGGARQPDELTADYLQATDDLKEVPTCTVNGRRLFYAVGTVSWDSDHRRIRNPYSDYGYYFLTESDDEPATIDEATFISNVYPSADDNHSLYEVDDYAWYASGCNLYDAKAFTIGEARNYTLTGNNGNGSVTVVLTADAPSTAKVSINGEEVGSLSTASLTTYDAMRVASRTFTTDNLQASNQITITQTSGGTMRLDYISLYNETPVAAPDLATASFPVPEYVYQITNQDHHADTAVDMVIIIPTSQKLLSQAERIKQLHEERDAMRVRIVPADELFNEFSSGTPDANAYRRYLKMLYDRAATDADMPRYLLLFGDGAWDNRMLTSAWSTETPDDYLLCYESENSYSATDSYVSDDFYCMLDDGEGVRLVSGDKPDVAVGRFPVRTVDEAKIMVDKQIDYVSNIYAGSWQNVIVAMGDDGNENQHMEDANAVAKMVETNYPSYVVKRVIWDAYNRVASATGNTYPDVTKLLRQQMTNGALVMNYSGHGGPRALSHENVLVIDDFQTTTSKRLPLWITASCDIMAFDGQEANVGESAILNSKGGAVAFFGTTRTVYQQYNRKLNIGFMDYVLRDVGGKTMPIGEAIRLTKNDLVNNSSDLTINKLHYHLLGDPALSLAAPTLTAVIDSINDVSLATLADGNNVALKAGATAVVKGRILNSSGQTNDQFDGVMTATVRDAAEEIVCKLQNTSVDGASSAFVYTDRTKTLFNGSDSVRAGHFSFTFVVPKDNSYSDATGLINIYAVSTDKSQEANGSCDRFVMNGSDRLDRDTIGPSIYCYLNSTSFSNGDNVNPTPYFVAELTDEDGINAAGNGIGHDLLLIIDGDMSKTYVLNDYFTYDFGSYTRGSLGFSIPELSYGKHRLQFRAWDILNNSSTAELTFNVVKGLKPVFFDVDCTRNPASTTTSFRIIHDRIDSDLDIVLDVFDISGRHLWSHAESGVPGDNTYTVDWDLSVDGGRRLPTGVYLYRLRIRSDGSTYASKAKKLIVLSNK